MLEKEFVPYQESLELKELGFDEPCLYYSYGFEHIKSSIIKNGEPQWMNHNNSIFSTCYSRPLYQQAFRWFREKYGLNHEISYAGKKGEYHAYVKDYVYGNNGINPSVFTYEEAELACLDKLIEIIKNK